MDLYEQIPEGDENEITFQETDKGFHSEITIHQDQLSKTAKLSLDLKEGQIFNLPKALSSFMNKILSRKNEIIYCVSYDELSVDISDVKGTVYLPLLTRKEINRRLNKVPDPIRKKLSMVHIGAVEILIKAQFRNGIDTPIKMALIDNRINDRKNSILGAARGNLAYGKFKFTVYPKFGLSLNTKNLDQVLSFIHEFEKSDLMNKGDKIFSVTYRVGYALTNSHHSIDYKSKPNIEIDDIFSDIGTIEESPFEDLTPIDNSWAIDIAKGKRYLDQSSKVSLRGNILHSGEPSIQRSSLASLSKRIDQQSDLIQKLFIE